MPRGKKTKLFLWIVAALVSLCACDRQHVIDRPIRFGTTRIRLTEEYIHQHYGPRKDIKIDPKIIVLHWTAINSTEGSFARFNPERLATDRKAIAKGGSVNVSAHFLVGPTGKIFRLMPETHMARHCIGLNLSAIGIENVGGAKGEANLTAAQLAANVWLIGRLKNKYPRIRYLIGHYEYQSFEGHPLWREREADYRTEKHDPDVTFVRKIRSKVRHLGITGAPVRDRDK